jgi:uncharacterized membrane protein
MAGLGAGTLAAWLLDPQVGRRRRAMVRDKAVRSVHGLEDAVDKGVRDLSHRAKGRVAEARGRFTERGGDDVILRERVRAELGRWVSHPHAIQVECLEGKVILSGPILEREVETLLGEVCHVRGVKDVENQLVPHASPEGIPSLQGGSRPVGRRNELMQENWSPSTRLLGGVGGAALVAMGLGSRGALGLPAALAGGLLLGRSILNVPVKRVVGIGAGRRSLDFHKTIEVRAPIDEVFAYWQRFENFPSFMEHVEEVRDLGGGRSHWVVCGPAGKKIEWDAEITRFEGRSVIAWRTVAGSAVQHAGIIHFEPSPRGTRLDIRMSYAPPAGAIGHTVASLFRADPKHAMDDDLIRFKSLLENGKATAHGTTVTRDNL